MQCKENPKQEEISQYFLDIFFSKSYKPMGKLQEGYNERLNSLYLNFSSWLHSATFAVSSFLAIFFLMYTPTFFPKPFELESTTLQTCNYMYLLRTKISSYITIQMLLRNRNYSETKY